MKIIDAVQGSPAWLQARSALPTASCFDKIATASGKPSGSAMKYMGLLLAEYLMGRPIDTGKSKFMERGTEMEGEARGWYAFETGRELSQVGFCLRDDGKAGCSPDALVGDDGLAEFKVPALETHMAYVLSEGELVKEYGIQVQGQLWITERKWADLVSYNPVLPKVVVRVERDEDFIETLADLVLAFSDRLAEAKLKYASFRGAIEEAAAVAAEDTGPF